MNPSTSIISIVDDSDFTAIANITETDIAACGGSVVHTMDGWLSPCCLGDGDGQCQTAALVPAQLDTAADEMAVAESASMQLVFSGAAVGVLSGIVAAITSAPVL